MYKVHIVLVLVAMYIMAAQASLMQYTFDGYVEESYSGYNFVGGTFNMNGYPLKYIIDIDVDRPGYQEGYKSPNAFYASYISGFVLTEFLPSTVNPYNYYCSYYPYSGTSEIRVGGPYHLLWLTTDNNIESWEIGQSFSGYENSALGGSPVANYLIVVNLILTGINAVPEPNAVYLLSLSFISLGCLARIRRTK